MSLNTPILTVVCACALTAVRATAAAAAAKAAALKRRFIPSLLVVSAPGAGAQDAGDRQHLLLAAGKLGALAPQPFLEVGEQLEDAGKTEPAGQHLRRQQQVLRHVEARKDAALL